MCGKNRQLNCWEPLKPDAQQRGREKRRARWLRKQKEAVWMAHGQILNAGKWAISSQAPNRGRFNDYPIRE